MAPSTTTTFDVHLSHSISAPVTVHIEDLTNLTVVTPSSMMFGLADYDVPQTVTVASHASSQTEIALYPVDSADMFDGTAGKVFVFVEVQ